MLLSAIGRFNERGGGGGGAVRFQVSALSADPVIQSVGGGCWTFITKGGGGGGGGCFRPILGAGGGGGGGGGVLSAFRCPPSRPIQSFNQWAEGAELLLQGGGGGGGVASGRF